MFEKEINEPKPEHFYLAQLASEISCLPYLVWGKDPPQELRDLKTWMLKFGDPEEIEKKSKEAEEQRAIQQSEFSSSVWASAVGLVLGADGKPVGVPKKKEPGGKPVSLPPHVRMATEAASGASAGLPTVEVPQSAVSQDLGSPPPYSGAIQRPKIVIQGKET